ncbi:NisI/SpaI family lantibiotic immunity lipoprotein [Streptococcus hyointestinalis]|nr:NisI/SpaI family lantibiotic immunity lipoprotein [Streptococcus hyointestinalis]
MMKRTIGYGRGVLFLLLAAVFLLTACQTKEKQQVSLDTNSQTLKIKGVAYDISNKEVSEDAIQKLAYRFKAYIVLDSDNKLRQAKSIRAVMDYAKEQLDDKKATSSTPLLFIGNVYQTADGLAVSIKDSYYKLEKTSAKSSDKLDLTALIKSSDSESRDVKLSSTNARKLTIGNQDYHISDILMSEDNLGFYVSTLSESVTFETKTGKILDKSELTKLTDASAADRTSWDYGDIYHTKENADDLVVAINNDYHLLQKEN